MAAPGVQANTKALGKRFFYLVALILLALAWMPAAAAQDNAAYIITAVDKSQYPTVQVQFRAIDLATNQILPGLTKTGLKVYENGQPVRVQELSRQNDGPLHIIFVIDLGVQSHYQDFGLASLRDAITALAREGFFVDGKDSVQVLARENINSDQTVSLLEPTQDASAFIDWTNRFDFLARSHTSRKATKGLQGIQDALDAAAKLVPVPGSQTVAIFFITHFIEEPVTASAEQIAQGLAEQAMRQQISLYAFQTIISQDDKKLNTPLTILSAGSINGYTPLYSGAKIASVNAVYQALQSQRLVYTVTYQSTAVAAGEQKITINASQPREADRAGSYELTMEELSSTTPEVRIVQPAENSTFRLEVSSAVDGSTVINGAKTATIVAEVTWPEGVAHRQLSYTQLFVGGAEQTVEPDWNSDQSRVTFLLDLTQIQQTQRAIPLVVKLGDGQNSIEAETTINVEVLPAPTKVPEKNQEEDPGGSWVLWLIAGAALVLLILLGVGAFLLIRHLLARSSQAARPPAPGALIREASGKQKYLATLSVLEGPPEMRGSSIDLPKMVTVMGRDPQEADIVFYSGVKSSISRVHCTIRVKAEKYFLMDNGSSNGTTLNSRRLQPDMPVELKNGDLISLGEETRNGVRLRFNLMPRTRAG